MDRTLELVDIANVVSSSGELGSKASNGSQAVSRSLCGSPFVLKASTVLKKLTDFQELLDDIYGVFVNYHKFLADREEAEVMTNRDRDELSKEITMFIATVASELNDLKYMMGNSDAAVTVDLTWLQSLNGSSRAHYQEMIAFITNTLSDFTKRVQKMHKEKNRLALEPFRLFSSEHDAYGDDVEGSLFQGTQGRDKRGATFSSLFDRGGSQPQQENKSSNTSGGGESQPGATASQSLVSKYERRAGTASQLRDYDQLASKHKEALMKEATDMQTKFSEDLQLATRMEGTVTQISELLTEFASILQAQGGQVDDVHDDAKQAEDHVKSSKSQLHLTLERSEKNQKSIVFLAVGLALLLLILDWIER